MVNHCGETYYMFNVAYTYDRKEWSFDVWARDWEDAKRKVQAIRVTLDPKKLSQVLDEFPANKANSLWVKAVMWWNGIKWKE